MKRKHILILSALLYCLLPYASVAQTEALKIGDQVPDINFPDAYNYRTTRNEPVKFSELKGKLVILDFLGHILRALPGGISFVGFYAKAVWG